MSKLALVTGGSAGIGLAISKALVKSGYQVVATSRNASQCKAISGIIYLDLELENRDQIQQWSNHFFEKYGIPEVLVNNAGFGSFHQWHEFPTNDIISQLTVMLESPILLCRFFAPKMAKLTGATIVNISSLAGQFPLPYMPAYNAAKAGLSAFSRTLMLEYRKSPLKIVDFRPGDFKTRFNEVLSKTGLENRDFARVWENVDKHLQNAPDVSIASGDFISAIHRRRSGIYYTGDFVQSKLGPLFFKLMPDSWLLKFIELYYRM